MSLGLATLLLIYSLPLVGLLILCGILGKLIATVDNDLTAWIGRLSDRLSQLRVEHDETLENGGAAFDEFDETLALLRKDLDAGIDAGQKEYAQHADDIAGLKSELIRLGDHVNGLHDAIGKDLLSICETAAHNEARLAESLDSLGEGFDAFQSDDAARRQRMAQLFRFAESESEQCRFLDLAETFSILAADVASDLEDDGEPTDHDEGLVEPGEDADTAPDHAVRINVIPA